MITRFLYYLFHPTFRHYVVVSMVLTLIAGIFFGKAMQAGAMIVLAGNAIINKNVKSYFKEYFTNKALLSFVALGVAYSVASVYHVGFSGLFGVVKSKLPLFFLPFSILAFPQLCTKKNILICIYFLIFLITLTSLYSWYYLLIDTAAIVDAYRKAKVLPTIINHIRYSMLLAFGLLWLVYFMVNNIVINHKVERKIQVLIFLYLFITLHVLAVRSGLILFYAGTLLYLTLVGFKHKKYKLLLGFYVVLMLMLMLMINAIPQLKNKIKYTKYDWDMHTQDIDLSQFSDGKRIAAYVASIDVISEKPWIGVGPTKVKPALDAYFSVHYPTLKSSFIDPHNQFLNAGVAAGLLGIVGLFVTVYVPFICSKMHHSSLSAAFLVMITLSFLVESTLETQLGLTIFIVLYLLMYKLDHESST